MTVFPLTWNLSEGPFWRKVFLPPFPPLCCFWLHIDLFTHSADMFGSRPFKSFVLSFDSWYSDKKACRPLYRIHSQHKPPGTIHPPIPHIGILDSLRNRSRDQINNLYYHRVPVPFWDRHPGSGPQFVVAEPGFPQRSKGRCHPMEKASWKPIQVIYR